MALPSAKDVCPRCGGPLESGFIRGDAGKYTGYAATISWEPSQPDALTGDSDDEARLAKLPAFRFQQSPRFPAQLCPVCRRVEFEFTEVVHQAWF